MASKQIVVNPKEEMLFFSIEIFDANAAYSWKFLKTENGAEVGSGQGDSQKYEVVKLPRKDSACLGFSLAIRFASDNVKGASCRISIYQGTDKSSLTLIGKFEPTIPGNPTSHRIDFVKKQL